MDTETTARLLNVGQAADPAFNQNFDPQFALPSIVWMYSVARSSGRRPRLSV